ncbi:F0F1 ATP synthase subunit A [Bacillus horti]|uniref:ATP synthase subunit a n=1 Tax=Caldalkalibacillus horti TaxID=77523 RepID=A0ABT9VZQ8_9BACI|nr:F0F1 ATP synthase subunit A [Bacillus horti]MDQ0166469.1 F-type H+-transporting ATPase subunit a [Bacillus horti]
MDHNHPVVEIFNGSGIYLNLSSAMMVTITAIIVFAIAYAGGRKAQSGKPSGMQNVMEWIIDFVRGIVANTMSMKKGNQFVALALTIIMFIFVGNFIGIPFSISTDSPTFGYHTLWWKSPTADAHVTLTLAITMIVLTHVVGISSTGFKNYFAHYFKPNVVQFPFHVIEEFTKTITLGLRLYGNIYAKEVLLVMLTTAGAAGIASVGFYAAAIPLMAWQAFGIFVGGIQAYVFTILTLVYISQKVEHDH